MEWDFTPEDVINGRAAYGLENFRADLASEVRMNLGSAHEEEIRRDFAVIYDLCYWLATGRDFESFLAGLGEAPEAIRLAKSVRDYMGSNVEMLGAILQRMIMERVEGGMPLERAVEGVAAYHASVVGEDFPLASPPCEGSLRS